jgi:hypothetical protein
MANCGLELVGTAELRPDGGVDGADGADGDSDDNDGASAPPVDGGSDVDGSTEPCTLATCDDAGAGCAADSVCAPAIPAGWHLLAVGNDPAIACSGSYEPFGAPAVRLANQPASCGSCTCAPGQPPSCAGNIQVSFGGDGTCSSSLASTYAADDGCKDITNFTVNAEAFYLALTPTGANPATCSGTAVTATIPPSDAGQLRICRPAGSACENDRRLCVPAPPSGLHLCIASDLPSDDAGLACPDGFEAQAYTAATSIADDRACSACPCVSTPANCTVDYTLYGADNCNNSGGSYSTTAQSTCQKQNVPFITGPLTFQGAKFKVRPGGSGGGCVQDGQPTPQGSARATGGYRVCCAD